MTTPTASAADPGSSLWLDMPHEHTRSCFWDYVECRWHCHHPVMRLASSASNPAVVSSAAPASISAAADVDEGWSLPTYPLMG